ncbi:hypothetical protein, partial [Dyella acidisoli]|uniref:hypothetical protein n=1 Tax=Dyella acidisoli TaxID=1867834 RepID=UPI0024E0F3A5
MILLGRKNMPLSLWDLISVSPQLGVCGIACGASGREATGSLFFAGPKKSNPKKWPEKLAAW